MDKKQRCALDPCADGGRLPGPYPFSHTPKPQMPYTGTGNRHISPAGEGNLNGRPIAQNPPNLGKGDINSGLAFRVPMDGDDGYHSIISDD